jgi:hypothetical protein
VSLGRQPQLVQTLEHILLDSKQMQRDTTVLWCHHLALVGAFFDRRDAIRFLRSNMELGETDPTVLPMQILQLGASQCPDRSFSYSTAFYQYFRPLSSFDTFVSPARKMNFWFGKASLPSNFMA